MGRRKSARRFPTMPSRSRTHISSNSSRPLPSTETASEIVGDPAGKIACRRRRRSRRGSVLRSAPLAIIGQSLRRRVLGFAEASHRTAGGRSRRAQSLNIENSVVHAPRRGFGDPCVGPAVDEPGQHVGQGGLRIDAVQLAGLDQRGQHRPVFRPFVAARRQRPCST